MAGREPLADPGENEGAVCLVAKILNSAPESIEWPDYEHLYIVIDERTANEFIPSISQWAGFENLDTPLAKSLWEHPNNNPSDEYPYTLVYGREVKIFQILKFEILPIRPSGVSLAPSYHVHGDNSGRMLNGNTP